MQTSLWKNFQLERTLDSSPTLRLKGTHPSDQTKSAESMHHSGGAATETIYIYGEAMAAALKAFSGNELRICSVGLGLGYNEILAALLILGDSAKSATLDSFEIDEELKDSFVNWINENNLDNLQQRERNLIYNQIFEKLNSVLQSKVAQQDLKHYLHQQIQSGRWKFMGELNLAKIPKSAQYNLCFFDAFSQKTSSELWTDHFLQEFVSNSFDQRYSLLATYACTGVLTRTLKSNGFTVTKKPGFQGKRDSTWAERKDNPSDFKSECN